MVFLLLGSDSDIFLIFRGYSSSRLVIFGSILKPCSTIVLVTIIPGRCPCCEVIYRIFLVNYSTDKFRILICCHFKVKDAFNSHMVVGLVDKDILTSLLDCVPLELVVALRNFADLYQYFLNIQVRRVLDSLKFDQIHFFSYHMLFSRVKCLPFLVEFYSTI